MISSPQESKWKIVWRAVALVALLYLFLLSIQTLGTAFKIFGKETSDALFQNIQNPFVGLLIGILATSLVQSSSVTTSTVVGLVGAGELPIDLAVPIMMGANIGTTVTNTLVSLGHISRKDEFRRAFSAATVHDFFNLITLLILFPLEIATGFLQKLSGFLLSSASGVVGHKFDSPVKAVVKPVANWIKEFDLMITGGDTRMAGILMVIFSAALIILSLTFMVKILRRLMVQKIESLVDHSVDSRGFLDNAFFGMLMGMGITVLVQSSSITTSILVPLMGAGVLTLRQVFPVTLGANVGTTVTALLASSATNEAGLQIALVHLLFNIIGILIVYPIPPVRRVPMWMAQKLADISAERRWVPLAYLGTVFFVIPALIIYFGK